MRERVAAIIERQGLVLMVGQRARGDAGHHDGSQYLTLPGGGAEVGESRVDAVLREVDEEVGLQVVSASCLWRVEHREDEGGATSLFFVEVDEGPATLGSILLTCNCPRLVGIDWITAPSRADWRGVAVRSLLKIRLS